MSEKLKAYREVKLKIKIFEKIFKINVYLKEYMPMCLSLIDDSNYEDLETLRHKEKELYEELSEEDKLLVDLEDK